MIKNKKDIIFWYQCKHFVDECFRGMSTEKKLKILEKQAKLEEKYDKKLRIINKEYNKKRKPFEIKYEKIDNIIDKKYGDRKINNVTRKMMLKRSFTIYEQDVYDIDIKYLFIVDSLGKEWYVKKQRILYNKEI